MKKIIKKFVAFMLFCSFVFLALACANKKVENPVGKVHLKVEFKNEILYENDLEVDNNTVYDLFEKAKLEYDMTNNMGGYYITSIESHTEKMDGPTSGWTYYINDEYATVSCDKHICEDGENITWKYVYE